MGRRKKTGLRYFPFEVDLFQDLKIRKLIKAKGGMAIAVYSLLLCMIYKQGFSMNWNEDIPFMVSEQTGFDEEFVFDVILLCVEYGLFSEEEFNNGVLTSDGIKKRHKEISIQLRRKVITSEDIPITSEETPITSEVITSINGNEPISSEKNTISSEDMPVSSEVITSVSTTVKCDEFISSEVIPISSEEIKKDLGLDIYNNNIYNNINIKQYKKLLLSEIKISDFPNLNVDYFKIALAFIELFRTNLIEAGASTRNVDRAKGTCIDDIRLIIEVDKYTIEDLREAYTFLKKDAFWKQNILSTSKLREQMDKLKLKIHGKTRKPNQEATSWGELAEILRDGFS